MKKTSKKNPKNKSAPIAAFKSQKTIEIKSAKSAQPAKPIKIKTSKIDEAAKKPLTRVRILSGNTSRAISSTVYYGALIASVAAIVLIVVVLASIFPKLKNILPPKNINPAGTEGTQTASIVILPPDQKNAAATSLMPGMAGDGHMTVAAQPGSIAAGSRFKFKLDHFQKLDVQLLQFDLFDRNNKLLKPADLQIVHESRLHFFVVSANLKEFQHLHPTFEKGKWRVVADLPSAGTYYAYADFTPLKAQEEVLRSELVVRQPSPLTLDYPAISENFATSDGPFTAKLTLTRPNLLQQTVLSYLLTVKDKGTPVKNLTNYLGAPGHLVILRQGDPESFMHVHPLSSSDLKTAMVEFLTTFSQPGRYTAFAQFKFAQRVHTFPLSFEIL